MGLKSTRYDEEFKQSLVALYNNGKIMYWQPFFIQNLRGH